MEAKVHYDISMTHKNPAQPSWLRRLAFLGAVSALLVYIYAQRKPTDFAAKSVLVSGWLSSWGSAIAAFFLGGANFRGHGGVVRVSD